MSSGEDGAPVHQPRTHIEGSPNTGEQKSRKINRPSVGGMSHPSGSGFESNMTPESFSISVTTKTNQEFKSKENSPFGRSSTIPEEEKKYIKEIDAKIPDIDDDIGEEEAKMIS